MATSVQLTPAVTSSFEELLAPLSSEEFLRRYWGQRFVHVPGRSGKFSHLLPWSRLNRILEYHRLKPGRLRLFRDTKEVPAADYLDTRDGREPRLKASEMTGLLADGATLIVDEMDDLDPAVRELAEGLERIFRIRIQVNMYAGWRTNNGFDLHFDDHDTMILQVSGRKRWQIFNPTRLHPFKKDAEEAAKPTEPPIWDGVFEEGGLFYIPRGWWHIAFPMDEPCLHLTVGFSNPTGLSLIHWLADQMKSYTAARKDLPHVASREEQSAYLNDLWSAIQDAWKPNLVESYMSSLDGRALPRTELQLPYAATPNGLALERNSRIRLTAPRRLDLSGTPKEGLLPFKCFGKSWQCPEAVLPALQALNDGQAHTVGELRGLAKDASGAFAVQTFLSALVMDGVASKVDLSDGQPGRQMGDPT
jgi:ribosomal protein L16 Arg81 hydroxylase